MTGYQEVLTDPSYKGQIVAMTYPLLGNYGVNRDDRESGKPPIEGFVVRELTRIPSNYRSQGLLDDFLRDAGVLGIEGIDARALVRRLHVRGATNAVLSSVDLDDVSLVHKARTRPGIVGRDLVREVTPMRTENVAPRTGPRSGRLVLLMTLLIMLVGGGAVLVGLSLSRGPAIPPLVVASPVVADALLVAAPSAGAPGR